MGVEVAKNRELHSNSLLVDVERKEFKLRNAEGRREVDVAGCSTAGISCGPASARAAVSRPR
jgi:hypothetical protein